LTESVRLAATVRLEQIADQTGGLDPEQVLARTGHTSRRNAGQTVRRAGVSKTVPQLGAALARGEISGSHLDAVANTLARLDPDQRQLLTAEGDWICALATQSGPEDLARALARRARQLVDDDGIARFERQRRATTLRHWTDPASGMVCLHGEFDPETGARFIAALHSATERLFHDAVPDTCPTDDRKQGHLRALALLHLIGVGPRANGDTATDTDSGSNSPGSGGAVSGASRGTGSRPEFIVVIDHDTLWNGLHEHSRVEVTGGVELPVETLRRMACIADIIPVVLNGAGVAVDVGRAQRLATADQRRALRAMYRSCAIHGCNVSFDNCQPHHLVYWHHGGPSDLANFVPLCSKHHHLAHEGGWTLTMQPDDRVLTVTLPDGTSLANPPPLARTG
jgi:Domain of unknown function (DUF222)